MFAELSVPDKVDLWQSSLEGHRTTVSMQNSRIVNDRQG